MFRLRQDGIGHLFHEKFCTLCKISREKNQKSIMLPQAKTTVVGVCV